MLHRAPGSPQRACSRTLRAAPESTLTDRLPARICSCCACALLLGAFALGPAGAQDPKARPASAAPAPAAPAPSGRQELTFAATLRHAAYRTPGAPSVVVHVPAGFDPTPPLELVLFLHGFMGCAQVLMADGRAACRDGDREEDGWALGRHHDQAHTNSVLAVVQLAFMKRSSKPGCFSREGCFDAFLDELLAELRARLQLKQLDPAQVRLTLVAHSAGYQATLAILDRSRAAQRVQNVVLMDALYGGAPRFAYWLQRSKGRNTRMLSIHLGEGETRRGSKDLYRRARRALGSARVQEVRAAELEAALPVPRSLLVATGRGIHRLVPENYLSTVLAAWLPARR